MRRLPNLALAVVVIAATGVGNAPPASASPFSVTFSTFIPGNHMKVLFDHCNRAGDAHDYYFQTDDRGFDFASNSYRTRQFAVVDTESGSGLVTRSNRTGPTRVFADDALANGRIGPEDEDGVAEDCHLFHFEGYGRTDDMHIEAARFRPQTVVLKLFGEASNGFTRQKFAISWDFTISIQSGQTPRCTISGDHDGFPAYEIYVNGHTAYTYWPGDPPYGLGDAKQLGPPKEEEVRNHDCTGALSG